MPGYQRFVAYVYEYRKGIKEENCGYIRVEAREEQCKIEIHVKCLGLPADEICEVKGIVRKDGKARAVKLGSCVTIQDGMQCLISCMTDNMDNSGVSLSEIGGLLLITKGGAFFGTEWDDVPIVPDEFLYPKEQSESESQRRNESAIKGNDDEALKITGEKGRNEELKIEGENALKEEENKIAVQTKVSEILQKSEDTEKIEGIGKAENIERIESIAKTENIEKSGISDILDVSIEVELAAQALPESVEDSRDEQEENRVDKETSWEQDKLNSPEYSNSLENRVYSEMQTSPQPRSISEYQVPSEAQRIQDPRNFPEYQVPSDMQRVQDPSAERRIQAPQNFPEYQDPSDMQRIQDPQNFPEYQEPSGVQTSRAPQNFPEYQIPSEMQRVQDPQNFPEYRVPSGTQTSRAPQNVPEYQIPSESQMPQVGWNSPQYQVTQKVQPQKTTSQRSLPGEAFEPFSDGEISECRKILPQAIHGLAPCDRSLRNNRFLMHGYYNFGHLLLGKTASGKYIIGVPGGYDQQERFMASMHGFPYFKESHEIRLRQSKGGYWYRLIHTPNFDKRNGF